MADWDGIAEGASQSWSQAYDDQVKYYLDFDDDDVGLEPTGYSLRRELVKAVAKSAMSHAKHIGAGVKEFEDNLIPLGMNVLDQVGIGLKRDWSDEHWNFWKHETHPLKIISSNKQPYMEREALEVAAADYLDLPYTIPLLERMLIDIMIALEMYAFGEHIVGEKPVWWLRSFETSPTRQRHVLLDYLFNVLVLGVILVAPALLILNFLPGFIGETASNWIGGILMGLFALISLIDAIFLPLRWWKQMKARKKYRELLFAMVRTYQELNTTGVISIKRLRDSASEAASLGVDWPPPLFALLDDNISRTGRV